MTSMQLEVVVCNQILTSVDRQMLRSRTTGAKSITHLLRTNTNLINCNNTASAFDFAPFYIFFDLCRKLRVFSTIQMTIHYHYVITNTV